MKKDTRRVTATTALDQDTMPAGADSQKCIACGGWGNLLPDHPCPLCEECGDFGADRVLPNSVEHIEHAECTTFSATDDGEPEINIAHVLVAENCSDDCNYSPRSNLQEPLPGPSSSLLATPRCSDKLRTAATKLQCAQRMKVARMKLEALRRQRAAVRAVRTLCAARQEVRALCAERQEAATKLQCSYRGKAARKELDELRIARRRLVEIQESEAAIKLQCAQRRMTAWRKSDELRKAATKRQCAQRVEVARMKLEELQRRRAAAHALCAARQEVRGLCAARQEAATKLQCAQRRRVARKELDELRTAMRKLAARNQLHDAVQRREIVALAAALEEAKAAGVPTEDMHNAEAVLGEERRKLAARNQLHDSVQRREIAALEAALEEARAARVPTEDLSNAEFVLAEERKELAARSQLHDAIASLEAALEEATAAGVPTKDIHGAELVLGEEKRKLATRSQLHDAIQYREIATLEAGRSDFGNFEVLPSFPERIANADCSPIVVELLATDDAHLGLRFVSLSPGKRRIDWQTCQADREANALLDEDDSRSESSESTASTKTSQSSCLEEKEVHKHEKTFRENAKIEDVLARGERGEQAQLEKVRCWAEVENTLVM